MNAFFKSQFSYCQLSWMFHDRTSNKKINRLHERYLRTIYNNVTSSFTDLLEIDNSVSVQIYRSWLQNYTNLLKAYLRSW